MKRLQDAASVPVRRSQECDLTADSLWFTAMRKPVQDAFEHKDRKMGKSPLVIEWRRVC